MKNKKMILAVVALVAVLAILLGVWALNRPETSEGSKTFTVTVVHKDGTAKEFTYSTEEEYLGAVLAAEGLIQGDQGEYGLMIHTVDGEKADWNVDQSYWALYVGEDYAVTGVDETPVQDGDSFTLEYTVG